MSTYYMINSARVGTTQYFPGELIDSNQHDITAIRNTGGVLWSTGNAAVDLAALRAQQAKIAGATEADLASIMLLAVVAAGSSRGTSSWTQAAWFIDPLNGSDSNTGLLSTQPLKTFAEVVARWGTTSPVLRQNTTVTWLNEAADPFADPIDVSPALFQVSLFFKMPLVAEASDVVGTYTARDRAAGTLGTITGTAITNFANYTNRLVRSTKPTLQVSDTVATGTTPPAAYFSGTPSAAESLNPIRIEITTLGARGTAKFRWLLNGVVMGSDIFTAATVLLGTTGITINFPAGTYAVNNRYRAWSDSWFWIDGPVEGGAALATATITAPCSSCLGYDKTDQSIGYSPPFNAPPWQSLTNGDPFVIYRPGKLFVKRAVASSAGYVYDGSFSGASVFFQNAWLVSYNDPTLFANSWMDIAGVTFQQCRVDSEVINNASADLCGAVNSHLIGGGTYASFSIYCGSHGGPLANPCFVFSGVGAGLFLDGDVIMRSRPAVAQGYLVSNFAYYALGVTVTSKSAALYISSTVRSFYATQNGTPFAAFWGPGVIRLKNGGGMRVINAGGATGITAAGTIINTPAVKILFDSTTANPTELVSMGVAGGLMVGTQLAVPGTFSPADLDTLKMIKNPITDTFVCMNGNNTP